MKLPKRIADILDRKQSFIDAQRSKMELTVVKQQTKLLNQIIAELIPELDVVDGNIVENAKNLRLISILDKTYKNFQNSSSQVIFNQIQDGTNKISDLSNKYFGALFSGSLPARFEKITANADKLINLRLGIDGGKLVRGGFLQSFFDSNTIGTELKQLTSKAVTSHINRKDYIKQLSDKITGSDEYTGGLERQFERFGYDIYQQYDAAYNSQLGNDFGFQYFIYQGGLVTDSRDFCAAHNNKVWSIEEAKEWETWTPSMGDYPADHPMKSKSPYQVPSYLGYPGYDPLIDRGGYNCRHSLGWISDDLAFDMRPDLKQ